VQSTRLVLLKTSSQIVGDIHHWLRNRQPAGLFPDDARHLKMSGNGYIQGLSPALCAACAQATFESLLESLQETMHVLENK
jgi:hypothetical protein